MQERRNGSIAISILNSNPIRSTGYCNWRIVRLIRRWNRLTRCQKNAILLSVAVICVLWFRSHYIQHPRMLTKLSPPNKSLFKGPSNPRQTAVVKAFQHAWKAYRNAAWGHDYLKPLSKSSEDWLHLGLTIVDSIDTIYIMGLTKEYDQCRLWVKDEFSIEIDRDVNFRETTVRILAGVLSAYHLTGDEIYLAKAWELGHRMLPVFQSPSGIPYSEVNLKTGKSHWHSSTGLRPNMASISEIASVQLEFRDLSRITSDPSYEEASFKVSKLIHQLPKKEGLLPTLIDTNIGKISPKAVIISLGRSGDAYYEYLLKQWIQTNKTIPFLRDDYIAAIDGVKKLLVRRSKPSKFLFLGQLVGKEFSNFQARFEHVVCFLPGTLALGVYHGMPIEHMKLAEELLNTCYQTYLEEPTRLAPEITYFNEVNGTLFSKMRMRSEKRNKTRKAKKTKDTDMAVKRSESYNLLRPEMIESLWYMYLLTGNKTYQDMGWKIFLGFENFARVSWGGYASLGSVRFVPVFYRLDRMESYFLSETLKYFYLLFGDRGGTDNRILSLDKFIPNTGAHFLPIRPY